MRRILPNTIHRQLFLYLTVIVTLLALFCIPLWLAWKSKFEEVREHLLHADADRMAAVFQARGPTELAAVIRERIATDPDALQIHLLLGPRSERLAGNLPQPPAGGQQPGEDFTFSMDANGRRIYVQMIRVALPGGYRLWVGRDITRYQDLESIFVRGLVGIGLIAFVVVGLATYGARRAALARIDTINRTTAAIVDGDLSQRLPLSGNGDEFDVLAKTVNRMLEQIDDLVQNVKHSSNAIAHDLRTPLAELRSHLEQLAITRPGPDETFAAIDAAIGDADRVIAIFNAILRLAEIDSGTRRAGFKPFDAAEVIEEAVEFYAPVAELKGTMLASSYEGSLAVRGDSLLLAQALGNLIDNALKYAGDGGKVRVIGQKTGAGRIDIVVADNGPGLAEQDRSRAAERFFRADPSRSSPGVGLGLALVSAVAKLHGGSLDLNDNAPGLRATIRIAAAEPPEHRESAASS